MPQTKKKRDVPERRSSDEIVFSRVGPCHPSIGPMRIEEPYVYVLAILIFRTMLSIFIGEVFYSYFIHSE